MDIDDIIASVDGPRADERLLDLQALTRAWVAERTAPELLPYPEELIERVMRRLRAQIELVEDMTGNMDPARNFALIVIQTELERFKFLVRSFLRARIAKIDKFPQHYLALVNSAQSSSSSSSYSQQTPNPHSSNSMRSSSLPQPSSPYPSSTTATPAPETAVSAPSLLSPTETQYLRHHAAILAHHTSSSFLAAFPPALQKLDDTAGGVSMVDVPDADTAVFVRVLRDCGTLRVEGEHGAGEVELRCGDVWVLRWGGVRERVRRGELEMI